MLCTVMLNVVMLWVNVKCLYSLWLCHYARYIYVNVVMLNAIILSTIVLSAIILSVIKLSVVLQLDQ
jgi:hypothetical protein